MSDCCSAPGLLPFEQALSMLLTGISPVKAIEFMSLTEALDRIVAEDIVSPINVPPHPNSAMDGYAFNYQQVKAGASAKLVGRSFAGEPFHGSLALGQCIRIMTGAKLPDCCDTVVMQEVVKVSGDNIVFPAELKAGSHVRHAGEDIKTGEVVVRAGQRLTTVDLGLLASLGIAQVPVFRQVTVALLATGDELKQPGQTLAEGDIYESNSVVLAAMLKRLNVKVVDFGIIKDDKAALMAAFEQANKLADVVISSGGVSVGEADYTKEILAQLGEIEFWKLAIKPGKPFAFGKLSDSLFFGLPGNPVSAVVTFHQLAVPGIRKLQGQSAVAKLRLQARAKSDLKKSPGRLDFQRGIVSTNANGELEVVSTGSQGSGILSSIAAANCYIILASEQGKVAKDALVDIVLFDEILN